MPLHNILEQIARGQGYSEDALRAAKEAIARKTRASHPEGSFDSAGRFTLSERRACCEDIRTASRAYPYSEMVHGRSATHIANLYDVPKVHVQRLVRALEAAAVDQESNHAKAQLVGKLKTILKPVHPN